MCHPKSIAMEVSMNTFIYQRYVVKLFYIFRPFEIKEEPHDFIEGMIGIAGAGDPTMREGVAVYVFTANKSMENKSFYTSDGDFLIGLVDDF